MRKPTRKPAKKPASIALHKYRRGIPWMAYDQLPEWIQKHQQDQYDKALTLAECEKIRDNMRKISDACKHAGERDRMIIRHDPATNRWASCETQDDHIILANKGKLKADGYANMVRNVQPCDRDRLVEIIEDLFPEKDAESIIKQCRSKGYLRFDSKADGYNDTWRGWDVLPPAAAELPEIQQGTKRDQYCALVRGIDKSRHSYKEPLEQSEFLARLDARVQETGWSLDVREGEDRWYALDRLRNRIWNVTRNEELMPLASEPHTDGIANWIWDRNLGLEQERIAALPKLTYDHEKEFFRIGKKKVESLYDGDPCVFEYDCEYMEPKTEREVIKYLCECVSFEWNVQQALQEFGTEHDNIHRSAYLFVRNPDGTWQGVKYRTPEEIAKEQELKRIEAEKKAAEAEAKKAEEAKRVEERMKQEAENKARRDLGLIDEQYDGWTGFPTILEQVQMVCGWTDGTESTLVTVLCNLGLTEEWARAIITDMIENRAIRVSPDGAKLPSKVHWIGPAQPPAKPKKMKYDYDDSKHHADWARGFLEDRQFKNVEEAAQELYDHFKHSLHIHRKIDLDQATKFVEDAFANGTLREIYKGLLKGKRYDDCEDS